MIPSDFDDLDAPGSRFLRSQASPIGNGHASKQKKYKSRKRVMVTGFFEGATFK
jgi:hypothetical protein